MKNIFESYPTPTPSVPVTPSVEGVEVTDGDRDNYTEREVSAVIVTLKGDVIEIVPSKAGIAVHLYTPYIKQTVIKPSYLAMIRYVQSVAGGGFTVVSNTLPFGEQLLDFVTEVYTVKPPQSVWTGV